ncbi:MAG TPA: cobalamin-independent methionine synthase II family protein [Dehalococcoidia bacterium]|nr:cobalamin-independent methionine synthase II family protein [Dehalococcoidia bacterium]
MLRSETRILTTHAGSLPRPPELVELFVRQSHGETVDPAALEAAVRSATRRVVARQLEAGIDIGNDGEQARESFFTYVRRRMSGFGGEAERPPFKDMQAYPSYRERFLAGAASRQRVSLVRPPKAIGAVAYSDRGPLERECAGFAEALAEQPAPFAEAFMTVPSPGIIAAAMVNEHYPSLEAYLDAVAEALAVEYGRIVAQGWLLQIDAPDLAMERHVYFAERPLADFLAFVERVIAAINRATAGLPRDRMRLHVCWGNYGGPHTFDVPLAEILSLLYRANAGALLLSMANPRHAHEYRCFARQPLPDGMLLIAGAIDTTTNYVEHPEVVAERIERAAQAVGDPRRVLAGTDCGFDTAAGAQMVADDLVWEKLRALRAGADLASRRLFG